MNNSFTSIAVIEIKGETPKKLATIPNKESDTTIAAVNKIFNLPNIKESQGVGN